MEIAHDPNERTPLLGDITATNLLRQPFRTSATTGEQTLLDGNCNISNGQAPLDEHGAVSCEQSPSFGEGTSGSDTKTLVSCPGTFDQETNEVSLEEIVQALYSAWLLNKKPITAVKFDFFKTKELCAMHLAWKNVTRGRHCSSQPHKIAEALASAINERISPIPRHSDEEELEYFYMYTSADKSIITVNLLREWKRITEGFGFSVRHIETVKLSDEPPLALTEFWSRQVELYDKVHDFFLRPKLQIILHTLIIIWPMSNLIVGSRLMECPKSHHLSYLLTVLACIGCTAVLGRLVLMYLTSKARNPHDWFRGWIFLRVIELTILIVFIVEAFHFFKTYPAPEPDPNQCVNFYIAALVLNYVSITLVSAYVLAYSIKMCVNYFDFWHWIFKHVKFNF